MSVRAIEPSRWPLLSPLLDELLDLEDGPRQVRLAELQAADAELAADLEALLAREAALDEQGFLSAPALPPPPGLAGQRLGAYTLERELGRGGMGQVWLARRTDGRFDGLVAIKLLRTGLLGHGDAARFEREGRVLARLDQPHIARLIDAGVSDDGRQPYLVLEYVEGEPIDRHVERHALTVAQRLRLMIDAADAVAHAHARLILHRDLKPSNMLVRTDGQLKLLDFGIAKLLDEPASGDGADLTQQAGALFTPSYAAPEQLQGQEVTTATDVYALGVLLYELLGGGHPTAGTTTTSLDRLRAAIEREPRPLSEQVRRAGGAESQRRARELRGDVDTIVAKALKKQPGERYANAAELADDLRRSLAHQPIAARPDSWLYRSLRFVRRHRMAVAAATVALVAVLGGAVVAVLEARDARAQREQAEGLLEFMLGDLRQKLQPVGRLDVLDAVGERALAYYAGQDAAGLDAASLGRRARALHLIGEIAERRGQLAEAGRRFTEAARSTAELLARAPRDPQRLFDHAQSEYWVAYVDWRHGRAAAAEAGFLRYRDLARRLLQADPSKPEWQLELAYAQQNLGVLLFEQGRSAESLQALAQARAVFEPLAGSRQAVAVELGNNLGWIARAHEAQGALQAALDALQAKAAVLQGAGASGSDRKSQYGLALAWHDVARLQLGLGRAAPAAASARAAAALMDTLVTLDGSNRDWRVGQASVQLSLAEALRGLGDRPAAAQALEAAAQAAAPTWGPGRDRTTTERMLRVRWLTARAAAGAAAVELAEMSQLVDAARSATPVDPAATATVNVNRQRGLALLALALGDALAASGDSTGARARWRDAVGLAPGGDTDWQALAVRAHALWRLDRSQEALTLADRLQAGPYRHLLAHDLFVRLGRPL